MEKTLQKKQSEEKSATTVKKYFPVLHMSCASCAASAQSTLQKVPGVTEASVNYADGKAVVSYNPNAVQPEEMKKSLQGIGYDLLISEEGDSVKQAEEIQQKEYVVLRRRTVWAIVLSVPLVILGMFGLNVPYENYIMWALATPIVFVFGQQFFIGAWKQIKHGKANMDTLVALSTGIAYLFSVFNLLFASFWISRGITPHVYFEAAGVIIAFIMIGKLLEERAKSRTSASIKKLMGLQPATVTRVSEDKMEEIPVSKVGVGDILLVKPGDKIAVDGQVISGKSYIDESMMSGEPWAVRKQKGDSVFSGTLNQKNSFQFRAEKVGGDTLLSQIIEMVKTAQSSRAPVQKLVDKIAGIFVPIVIGIALLSLIAWVIFGGSTGFIYGLLAMVTVLIIACPCALGLATPTAIMVGMGKGAEQGILIKDATTLEEARKINAVVLDKTGTLTEGRPEVTEIIWLKDKYDRELKSLEKQSGHPLAEAIVNYISSDYLPVENFEDFSGKGVKGKMGGEFYFAGNKTWLKENEVEIPLEFHERLKGWNEKAYTLVFFAKGNTLLASIAISDRIKENAGATVHELQQEGMEVYMLTGDQENTAQAVAKQVGISRYQAQLLPEDKIEFIKKLQTEGKVVAMVGDGINDSAALAQADVSMAMGKGSAIAMDIARMTILSSDLSRIPKAIKLSKQTTTTIRENLFWALIYNIIAIPIAAGILYPFNGFLLNPMIAGAAMALSSVSVVTNSLRLKRMKL